MEYYYEEDYPDCYGEVRYYSSQPACLTCVWKGSCGKNIEKAKSEGEDQYDYEY